MNPDLKTGAHLSESRETASLLRYEKSISVTSAILISKVQPCPTSSGHQTPFPRGRVGSGHETMSPTELSMRLDYLLSARNDDVNAHLKFTVYTNRLAMRSR